MHVLLTVWLPFLLAPPLCAVYSGCVDPDDEWAGAGGACVVPSLVDGGGDSIKVDEDFECVVLEETPAVFSFGSWDVAETPFFAYRWEDIAATSRK